MCSRLFAILLILAAGTWSGSAAQRIFLTVTVTNAAVTGDSITVNADTRTFTNATTSATIITNTSDQTNVYATKQATATNLWRAVARHPFTGPINVEMTASNVIRLMGQWDASLSGSSSGTWCTLSLSTQTVSQSSETAIFPFEAIVPETSRTNQASQFVAGISSYSTNAFATNSAAVSNLVNTGPGGQVIQGGKTWLGTNYAATIIGTNVTIHGSTNISGTLNLVSNGLWRSGTAVDMVVTNLQVPGTGANSVKVGYNGLATGDESISLGTEAYATNSYAVAVGNSSIAGGAGSVALGFGANVLEGSQSSIAIGYGASIFPTSIYSAAISGGVMEFAPHSMALGGTVNTWHSNSVAIGYLASTTKTNQIRIGAATHTVSIPGRVENLTSSNSVFRGTNYIDGEVLHVVQAIATLADGANNAVPGSNSIVRFTGSISTNSQINGITGGKSGRELRLENRTGYTLTLAHQSGLASAADRLMTPTGLDIDVNNAGWAFLLYNGTSNRWAIATVYPQTNITVTATATNTDAVLQAATNYADSAAAAAMQAATNYADANDDGQAVSVFINGVTVTSLLTNLHFISGSNTVLEVTNSPAGDVAIRINAAGGGTVSGDAILQSATNYTDVATNTLFGQSGLIASNAANAALQSATNYADAATNTVYTKTALLAADQIFTGRNTINSNVVIRSMAGTNAPLAVITPGGNVWVDTNGYLVGVGVDAYFHITTDPANWPNQIQLDAASSSVYLEGSLTVAGLTLTATALAGAATNNIATTNYLQERIAAVLQASTNYADANDDVGGSAIPLQTNSVLLTAGVTNLNYISGTNVCIEATNDSGRVDIRISASAGSSGDAVLESATNFTRTATNTVFGQSGLIASNAAVAAMQAATNYTDAATNGFVGTGITNGLAGIDWTLTLSNLHLGAFGTLWTNYADAAAVAAMQAATNYADANDDGQAVSVFTNTVAVTSLLTNLDIIAGTNVVIEAANTDGHVTLSINAAGGGSGADHTLLSSTHTDTTAAAAVDGDMLYASGTNWTRLERPLGASKLIFWDGHPRWLQTNECYLSDDFLGGSSSSELGWTYGVGSGGSAGTGVSYVGFPGLAYTTCKPTNTASYGGMRLGYMYHRTDSWESFIVVVKFVSVSSLPSSESTNGFACHIGFETGITSSYSTDGAWFQADTNSPNWCGVTGNASYYSTNDLGIPLDAGYHVLRLDWLINTNVVFSIDNIPRGTNSDALAMTANYMYPNFRTYSTSSDGSGAYVKQIFVDKWEMLINKGSSARP